jgi:hypothetical protein
MGHASLVSPDDAAIERKLDHSRRDLPGPTSLPMTCPGPVAGQVPVEEMPMKSA